MLQLASRTAPDWIDRALGGLDELLVDHAHCEKKAASTAINLIFRYADRTVLLTPLSELAREELDHFEQVLALLGRRGVPFRRIEPTAYAPKLLAACRADEPSRLLDTLLCCSLIESRSCERMGLLAAALPSSGESELAVFYGSLLESEARHHSTYVDLARATGLFETGEIRERLRELAAHEARVIADLDPAPRLHG